jgi:cytochrome c nitrite reductase small subunit
MNSHYASWVHSSHRNAANCNDCHVPHNNFVNKYFFKAKDGLRHATMFTLHLEPQVIRIEDEGQKVVHKNCLRCHGSLFALPHLQSLANTDYYADRIARQCWDCHNHTPHGDVAGLSATPNAMVPNPGSVVPLWLQKITKEK